MKIQTLSAVVHAAVSSVDVAVADSLPKRKAGLWEVSFKQDFTGTSSVTKQCVDEATDAKMMQMGNEMKGSMKEACSSHQITAIANGFESKYDCQIQGVKMAFKGTFTGDFSQAYTGRIETGLSGPGGQARTMNTDVSAKWVGPCAADMKPGDIITDTGKRANIDDLTRRAEQAFDRLKDAPQPMPGSAAAAPAKQSK